MRSGPPLFCTPICPFSFSGRLTVLFCYRCSTTAHCDMVDEELEPRRAIEDAHPDLGVTVRVDKGSSPGAHEGPDHGLCRLLLVESFSSQSQLASCNPDVAAART